MCLCQDVFARVVAAARSSARTTAVLAAMYGTQIDQNLLRSYEVVSGDPACEAIGSLMEYEDDTFQSIDPGPVITSAMEMEGGRGQIFAREVLGKDPGGIIFEEFVTDLLRGRNASSVVDLDMLGSLAEFTSVGTSGVTSNELDAELQDKILNSWSKDDMRRIVAKIEESIRRDQIHHYVHPSSDVGSSREQLASGGAAGDSGERLASGSIVGSVQPDFHSPDAGSAVGTLHTIAHKLAADIYSAHRNAPPTDVGSEYAHTKFACSSVDGDGTRMGSPYWKHLADTHSGAKTIVSEKLYCLLCEIPDQSSTDRLDEFVKGAASSKTYRLAMKPNGALMRLDEPIAAKAVEVRNEAAKILQGYFSKLDNRTGDMACADETVTLVAVAQEVERISGERGFLKACLDGEPLCEWTLRETIVRPLAPTFLNAQGADTGKSLAIIKRRLADYRDQLGSDSKRGTAESRERLASGQAGGSPRSQPIKPSRADEGMSDIEIAEFINNEHGGLHANDPDMASKMLRDVLVQPESMTRIQKLFACTLFGGLSIKERALLSTEGSMHRLIGHIESTKPEPEAADGRIPDGGSREKKTFLHLHGTVTGDEAGNVTCRPTRNPDLPSPDLPMVDLSDEVREAVAHVLQNRVYTWGPAKAAKCPEPGQERPCGLIANEPCVDPVNRIRGIHTSKYDVEPNAAEQRRLELNDAIYPEFTRLEMSDRDRKAFTTMSRNEKSCVDNVLAERYGASESWTKDGCQVSRYRQSWCSDLNPKLDPHATAYTVYLRYHQIGMCSWSEFKKLKLSNYQIRLFYRMPNFLIRHVLSQDTTVELKNGAYNEWYDLCARMGDEATRWWAPRKQRATPGTSKCMPPQENALPERRGDWRGIRHSQDARAEYNCGRSRPLIGTNQASIFSILLLMQMSQDMGMHWLEEGHILFVFVFSSIFDHEDKELQLQPWQLDRLFNGQDYGDYMMGYPRFTLFGESQSDYFFPGAADAASWYDANVTGLSAYGYRNMKMPKSHYGLPDFPCRWYGIRVTGVAATDGHSLVSHLPYWISSEIIKELAIACNKVGHYTTASPMEIAGSDLGSKNTTRVVQAALGNPSRFPKLHGERTPMESESIHLSCCT